MKITKLLALVAIVVVGVACDGVSPTSPNATVPYDDATAVAEATAAKDAVPDPGDCRAITEVDLRLLRPTEPHYARIRAVYLKGNLLARCQEAPTWFSRPRDRVIQTRDPFIVKVFLTRSPSTVVEVTSVAPNGVRGSIRVQ